MFQQDEGGPLREGRHSGERRGRAGKGSCEYCRTSHFSSLVVVLVGTLFRLEKCYFKLYTARCAYEGRINFYPKEKLAVSSICSQIPLRQVLISSVNYNLMRSRGGGIKTFLGSYDQFVITRTMRDDAKGNIKDLGSRYLGSSVKIV